MTGRGVPGPFARVAAARENAIAEEQRLRGASNENADGTATVYS